MVLVLVPARKGQSQTVLHNRTWLPGLGPSHSSRQVFVEPPIKSYSMRKTPSALFTTCSLLCVRYLFPLLVIDTKLLRHRLERRIELNESVLDGTVRVVTRPAAVPFGHSL